MMGFHNKNDLVILNYLHNKQTNYTTIVNDLKNILDQRTISRTIDRLMDVCDIRGDYKEEEGIFKYVYSLSNSGKWTLEYYVIIKEEEDNNRQQ